jgi:protein-S-isoprenylcysteine O-methyltransferase Ste14
MKPQLYRLIYVIIATFLLIAILMFSSMIDSGFLYYPNNILKLIGLLLAGWGLVISKVAFKSYDTKAFLGLGSLHPEDEFRTDGLLKKVRHPLYSGSILLLTGYFLFSPKISVLISVSMMIIYFLVGIQFEEKKLAKVFGEKYIYSHALLPPFVDEIVRPAIQETFPKFTKSEKERNKLSDTYDLYEPSGTSLKKLMLDVPRSINVNSLKN